MHIGRITGATHNLGAPKDWDPAKDGTCDALPIRAEPHGEDLLRMYSAWMPTPEEIALIAAGAPIHLMVLGSFHPPVMLTVGNPPSEV
jgi:hypothetical protein